MSEMINSRTPEEIKAGLAFCTTGNVPGYGCNVHCPYLNTPNCWLPVKSDALELIKRIEAERDAALAKMPKWISVEEKLPDNDSCYMAYFAERSDYCLVAYEGDGEWIDRDLCNVTRFVTHWMPLPEPPEVSE